MNKEHTNMVRRAYNSYSRFRENGDKLVIKAEEILTENGIDMEKYFFNFSFDYFLADGLCFTMEIINDIYSPHVITCKAFFDYFDHSYKEGDDIIEELKERTI